ncbi:hypothetical protein RSAG8_01929, partial [Rhizoctonia solani AG-8 WAC10335]
MHSVLRNCRHSTYLLARRR